jgi:hypothetical protein
MPQRIFGRAPVTHAVAYAIGEIGLISPKEFARLNLSGFSDLQMLAVKTKMKADGAANRNSADRTETNAASLANVP